MSPPTGSPHEADSPRESDLIGRVPRWIVRHSLIILLASAALTLFFAAQLPGLELDPSAESLMLEDDPAREYYERVKEIFGSDSIIAIAIHRPDTIFRPKTLTKIKHMAEQIERLSGVERVASLATTDNFANSREGLKPGPLYTDVPTSPEELADLRRQALANHSFIGNLLSRDTRSASLIVFVDLRHIDRSTLAQRMREAVEQARLPRDLLDDLLQSPRFASAVWGGLPAAVRETCASIGDAAERSPDTVCQEALRLLSEGRRLRRAALREAPVASRRRVANLVDQIAAILRSHSDEPEEEIYQIGNPVMKVAGARYQREDHLRLLPGTILVVAVVLFVAFRSVTGVLIPLGTVGLSVVWTFGLMAYLGIPLTVISVIIGPLLIAVGNCYAMHLVAHYYELSESREERTTRVERALQTCFLPVLLAGATTMLGFLSVTFSRLSSIREFGLFSAYGILCSLVISLVVAPAVLRYLPQKWWRWRGSDSQPARKVRLADRALRLMGRLAAHHGGAIMVFGALAVAASVLGCFFVRVNTNYTGFFHHSDPIRIHSRRIHEELAGAVPISVIVDARGRAPADADREDEDWRGPLTEPVLLRFLLDLQAFTESLRVSDEPDAPLGIDKTVSFADQVKLMYQSFMNDRRRDLPATREAVESLLDFFYDRDEAEKYVSEDFTQAHVYLRTYLTSSQTIARLVGRIEEYAKLHAPPGVRVTITGETVLILRAADEIALGQVRSLAIACGVIFTLMGILFRSFTAGLISIPPNVIPIVGTFGLMGWLGIDLNTATSLVASVAIGIAVDDTIHYMTGFRIETQRVADPTEAMLNTLHLRGRAIMFTSVALFFGFMVLTASRFAPIASFGCLTAIAMFMALLGDLLVLPVLLRHVRTWSPRHLLRALRRTGPGHRERR